MLLKIREMMYGHLLAYLQFQRYEQADRLGHDTLPMLHRQRSVDKWQGR